MITSITLLFYYLLIKIFSFIGLQTRVLFPEDEPRICSSCNGLLTSFGTGSSLPSLFFDSLFRAEVNKSNRLDAPTGALEDISLFKVSKQKRLFFNCNIIYAKNFNSFCKIYINEMHLWFCYDIVI